MIGIKSTDSERWSNDVIDQIYRDLIDDCDNMYIKSMREVRFEDMADRNVCCNKYEVLMIDCTTPLDVKINHEIVTHGLADYDPQSKHFLEASVYVPHDLDEDIEAPEYCKDQVTQDEPVHEDNCLDIQFAKEEICKLFNLPETVKFLPPREPTLESPSSQRIETNLKKSGNPVSEKPIPKLSYLYKCPQIQWQQSESLIRLTIAAVDCLQYTFELNLETLLIM